MKKNKKRRFLVIFFALVCMMSSIQVLPVSAGASRLVIDRSSFAEKLDSTVWNNMEEDIIVQDGALIFPKDGSDLTSLITKTSVKASKDYKNLVETDVTMKFTSLPKEETFAFAFGLSGVESMMGEPGNVEIKFTQNGKLYVSVEAYNDEQEATVIAQPVACGSVGNTIRLKAVISNAGILTLHINGKQICNAQLPTSGEGRVGFLQTGSCGATVTDLQIVSYRYDRPENCDIFEDFEKEAINSNLLTSKIIQPSSTHAPSRIAIEEVNGNRALRFENTSTSYIGTCYQYSNFEMSFDVVYLQREDIYDEDGNITKARNDNIVISFGDETQDYSNSGYTNSADAVVVDYGSGVYSLNLDAYSNAEKLGYPFAKPECDKNFSLLVSVIDSVVTVKVKWMEEKAFTEILQYELSGETPLGYVHIWTTGRNSNFALDNLSIKNKDANPQLIEVDYKSALIEKPADFKYEPMSAEYEEREQEEQFNPYLLIPAVALICVFAFLVNSLIQKKLASRKEENHEKME